MPDPYAELGADPGVIADVQADVIAQALAAHPGASPERLSELVYLPVGIVRRRLAEIAADREGAA